MNLESSGVEETRLRTRTCKTDQKKTRNKAIKEVQSSSDIRSDSSKDIEPRIPKKPFFKLSHSASANKILYLLIF